MSDQVNASELLQQLMDDRYSAGYATGNSVGYIAGFEAGYAQALDELADVIKTKMPPGEQVEPGVGSSLANHPGDENDGEADDEAKPPMIVSVQPNLKRALEYLKQHPGMTAHEARDVVRNRNAFRMLHRLGLAEKRGPKFFPKSTEAHR
jgi:hypothetical protein